jgi:hypothetical protein
LSAAVKPPPGYNSAALAEEQWIMQNDDRLDLLPSQLWKCNIKIAWHLNLDRNDADR